MDDIKMNDIEIVGSWVSRWGVYKETLLAWNRIKKTLNNAPKNTIHNSGYMAIPECSLKDTCKNYNKECETCPDLLYSRRNFL